ncbi:helix-turn-helix domain-containing protein, partial [candidate division WOR-3 bacterium]|nr:helix-turn-helix domain-containing protein [candidate division WOR-3 bacterium]
MIKMFPHMNNRRALRLKVALHYLQNGVSLRQTALTFHIAYRTIFNWVKRYREQGEEGLLSTYKRPWNRAKPDFEEKIALMKEHDPGLTVRKAREYLEKEGIRISIKGIWGIWKRYGYAGLNHRNMARSFIDCSWTSEAKEKCESARRFFDQDDIKKAAELLNSVPAMPANDLLSRIPDSLLNLRRQVEKNVLLFGMLPVHSYLERLGTLYDDCCGRKLYYSTLVVGLTEIKALSWSGEPLKMLSKAKELRDLLEKNGDCHSYILFAPRLSILISEGIANLRLLKTEAASGMAKICRQLLKRQKYVSPFLASDLAQLYAQLENYREAEYWYLAALATLTGEDEKLVKSLLTDVFVMRGDYKRALSMWAGVQLDYWGNHSKMLRIQSVWSLIRGAPNKGISYATSVLASLKKEGIQADVFGCNFTIASAYCSLGERTKAAHTLTRVLPFLVRNRLEDMKTIVEILLSRKARDKIPESLEHSRPTIILALLLKNRQYTKALKYAERRGIMGMLHRYIFFFPEAITPLLEK